MRRFFSRSAMYVALQRIVGADVLRYRCIDRLALTPGETVVDVGCGPAYYFEHLPQPVKYHGFDTERRHIDWATGRWGDRADFHLGTFDAASADVIGPVDAVLLLGVLHHLPDEQSAALLQLIAGALSPVGRVVSVDTCFERSQGRVSRWMAEHDRGDYVRTGNAFKELAQPYLTVVESEMLSDVTRIPGSYWMMLMERRRESKPLP